MAYGPRGMGSNTKEDLAKVGGIKMAEVGSWLVTFSCTHPGEEEGRQGCKPSDTTSGDIHPPARLQPPKIA